MGWPSYARVERLTRRRLSCSRRDAAYAARRRPGPVGACSDADLAEHIRLHITGLVFTARVIARYGRGCAPPAFARATSCARVMGEHGLLAPHRAGRTEAKAHDGTIVTDRVNEMWGTDMTQTITTNEARPMSSSLSNTPIRKSSHSRGAFSQSLRGVGADAPGRSPLLRNHRARRGARIETAS